MKPNSNVLVVVWIASLLLAPWLAYVFGVQQQHLENRRPASAPDLSPGAVLETTTYKQFAAFFRDHVPLRDRAVWLDAWIDLHVLRDSPSTRVTIGADGWLYRGRLANACTNPIAPREVTTWLADLSAVVESSGREFVFVLAPGKAIMCKKHLGPLAEYGACYRETFNELRRHLDRSSLGNYVDMWPALQRNSNDGIQPACRKDDAHWSEPTAALMAQQLVDTLAPGLWSDDAVVFIDDMRTGDYSRMIGMPASSRITRVDLSRPGINLKKRRLGGRSWRYTATGHGPVLASNAYVLHDSSFNPARTLVGGYLTESTFVHWGDRDLATMERAAEGIIGANIVVVQRVHLFNPAWFRKWRAFPEHLARRLGTPPPASLHAEPAVDVAP